ncbi:hypothetical protein BDZ45DRAFT_609009 [Acephala macrosclerotiorum]|nr:hypothetical protein BDZ45DRAFT_609009 [Acephala macrosclerotiorum]
MSFGWSAGDIVAAVTLVGNIISCVQTVGGSREHFQELAVELHGLEQALTDVAELTKSLPAIPEAAALDYVSCSCRDTLERFYKRIKPFENSLGATSSRGKLKAAPRMVRWELLVKKDIPELRTYLVAHVGYINMRLNAATLRTTSNSRTQAQRNHENTSTAIQQLNTEAIAIREKISLIPTANTVPTLETLMTTTSNIWEANSKLMNVLVTLTEKLPPPNPQFTWAQAPVKLEDALGRIIPIPSEYDWGKVYAVIQAQFSSGPGSMKVRSGEFELLEFVNGQPSTFNIRQAPIRPGMSIIMAIIIGQYAGSTRCPRAWCKSPLIKSSQSGDFWKW